MCPVMEINATYTLVTAMADTVRFPLAPAESSPALISMNSQHLRYARNGPNRFLENKPHSAVPLPLHLICLASFSEILGLDFSKRLVPCMSMW